MFAPGEDVSWLDSTQLVIMETHDRMASRFGLEVSSLEKKKLAFLSCATWLHAVRCRLWLLFTCCDCSTCRAASGHLSRKKGGGGRRARREREGSLLGFTRFGWLPRKVGCGAPIGAPIFSARQVDRGWGFALQEVSSLVADAFIKSSAKFRAIDDSEHVFLVSKSLADQLLADGA